jgi:hypothetical protein
MLRNTNRGRMKGEDRKGKRCILSLGEREEDIGSKPSRHLYMLVIQIT